MSFFTVHQQRRRLPGMRVSPRMKGFWGVVMVIAGAALIARQSPGHHVFAASGGRINPVAEAAQAATSPQPSDAGAATYAKHCAICHGEQREGILPGFPPLAGIKHQLTDQQITDIVAWLASKRTANPGQPYPVHP